MTIAEPTTDIPTGRPSGPTFVELNFDDGLDRAAVETITETAALSAQATALVLQVSGRGAEDVAPELTVVNKWEAALRSLERADVPIVATATGPCHARALEVFLTADVRIASPTATFALADPGRVWPGMALHRVVTQIGAHVARRLLVEQGELSAQDALDVALVDRLVDDPRAEALRMLSVTSRLPNPDHARHRQLIFDAGSSSFEEALGRHLAAIERLLRRIDE
ncbi:enoyl-CoA-hydratase DpgB [Terracoccus luteus]|jgi:isomerase DpgB|uniref:Isomerase DpgB n=1 Tax=Terracoccus luteus TaxID=53356 RepID=A0A839Q242_9MICO|nr:enoyl-CoA-hydratase DpgB [Terracoccus luteus]MBB2988395.1 isomerase DpgB [Terracoccus luteus]MCP2173975.1 isomerase DpgB [Terracoccus luteus]